MLDITTDLTRITRKSVRLPENYDFTGTSYEEGEWVELAAGNRITRASSTVDTSHNTFPLWTHTDRADVKSSLTMTVPYGVFEAVTDNYTGSISVGDRLTVQQNTSDNNRGRLAVAASGDAVRAVCVDTDATASTITFRMLDGGFTLP